MQTVTKPKESDQDVEVRADPVEEQVRTNLNKFITESGYSQQQVADMAGIVQASLGRYCRGENAMPMSALPMLADVLGHSVSDFFQGAPPPGDLESAPAVFVRKRPGIVWTDEDQADTEQYLERIRSRRIKKRSAKKP